MSIVSDEDSNIFAIRMIGAGWIEDVGGVAFPVAPVDIEAATTSYNSMDTRLDFGVGL